MTAGYQCWRIAYLDGGGTITGWHGLRGQQVPAAWESIEFADRAAADRLAADLRMRGTGTRVVEVQPS